VSNEYGWCRFYFTLFSFWAGWLGLQALIINIGLGPLASILNYGLQTPFNENKQTLQVFNGTL
jgi:hypothetical protein